MDTGYVSTRYAGEDAAVEPHKPLTMEVVDRLDENLNLAREVRSRLPIAAWALGTLACALGAPLVNLGWRLREWALRNATD